MEIQYPVIVAEYAVIVARSEIQKIAQVIAARQTVRQTKLPRRSLEIDAILYSVMVAEYSVIVARQTVRQTKLPRRSLEIDAILYSVILAENSVIVARSEIQKLEVVIAARQTVRQTKLPRLDLGMKLHWYFL